MSKTDQHSRDTSQLKAWVATCLKNDFIEACQLNRATPSVVLRLLMRNYVQVHARSQKNG